MWEQLVKMICGLQKAASSLDGVVMGSHDGAHVRRARCSSNKGFALTRAQRHSTDIGCATAPSEAIDDKYGKVIGLKVPVLIIQEISSPSFCNDELGSSVHTVLFLL